ncbi:MAG: 50S ribosomal protein L13 [Patescibacteria group bacterium]|nr:50S ribosomal protein L13 [Patescibacteria group bacterium]
MKKEQNSKLVKKTQRQWHIFEASEESFGRMATQIAIILRGKNKASYTPHIDGGDYVVVINSDNLKYTKGKGDNKIYYHYSGYMGGMKKIALKDQIKKDSRVVIKNAVYGMLPKNKLRDQMIKRLNIYTDANHPYKEKFGN